MYGDTTDDDPEIAQHHATIEFDAEAFECLRDAYEDAVKDGYGEEFDVFALNHSTAARTTILVDGEPVTLDG